jgi:hypothetical protein
MEALQAFATIFGSKSSLLIKKPRTSPNLAPLAHSLISKKAILPITARDMKEILS